MSLADNLSNIDDKVAKQLEGEREEALIALSSLANMAGAGLGLDHTHGGSVVEQHANVHAATQQLLGG